MSSSDTDLPVPDTLKPIRPYMLLAKQHDNRDKLISYFCMRYAMETAMRLVKRAPEDKKFLFILMDSLEKRKHALADNEAFQNEMICNSYVENYAIKIFSYADNEDRAGRFNQNLAKTFYKAGLLLDVLQTFGELAEELQTQKKYAKYKAANISSCLKNGETPKPGPPGGEDDEEGAFSSLPPAGALAAPAPGGPPAHPNLYPPGQPPTGMYPPPNQYPPQHPSDMLPPQDPGQTPSAVTPMGHAQPGAFAPPTTPEQPPAGAMQPQRTNSIQFSPEDYTKASKLCKFAISALQYEDVPEAVTNLEKALRLLKTGRE